MQCFMKIKPSQNGEITLLFTDIGKSCPSRKFLMGQICLLPLFMIIKFLQKFLDLQYIIMLHHDIVTYVPHNSFKKKYNT